MAQFTAYSSADASAPVLSGTNGALVALLDAILVDGYGSKAAAGWTKAYSGTNKAAYRSGAGTQFYLRVLDDGSLTGAARDAGVRGYESMSDVDTGTNPFPTVAQQANGLNWRKSSSADATARTWQAYADSRTLYLFVITNDTNATTQYVMYMFGDFYSYNPTDAYNCCLMGATSFSAAALNMQTVQSSDMITAALQGGGSSARVGKYKARIAAGTGTSTQFSTKGDAGLATTGGTTQSSALLGVLAYPNTADGGLYLHPVWLMDDTTPDVVHGELRGLFQACHAISFFGNGDTFGGAGGYAGRTFGIIKQSPNAGVYVLETSNTVNTN
jgi:hypothetical protein